MRVRVLEWIGLIMADMLSFLVVGLAFLYTFTEPMAQTKAVQLAQRAAAEHERQVERLKHTVQGLQRQLAGAKESKPAPAPEQAQVRLFPGDVLVYAPPGGEPRRLDVPGLVQVLQKGAGRSQLVLSAETGVGYDRLTGLAEELMQVKGVAVRFGW